MSAKDCKHAIYGGICARLTPFFEWQQLAVGATRDSFIWVGKIGRNCKLSNDVTAAPHSLANMVERRLIDAGLVNAIGKPITTLHGLRATGATLAAEAGVNPPVIQQQLGHAELRTTQESYLSVPDPDLLAPYAAVFS